MERNAVVIAWLSYKLCSQIRGVELRYCRKEGHGCNLTYGYQMSLVSGENKSQRHYAPNYMAKYEKVKRGNT